MNASYDHLLVPHLLDSRLKLHLLLHYWMHPAVSLSAAAVSERLRENPWAVADALNELADAGLLARRASDDGVAFQLGVRHEYRLALHLLVETFNDPLLRDVIYTGVHNAYRERQYTSCPVGTGWGAAGLPIC